MAERMTKLINWPRYLCILEVSFAKFLSLSMRGRFKILLPLGLMVCLSGCAKVKTQASHTLIDGRRSLASDFRPNLVIKTRSESTFLNYSELEKLAENPTPKGYLARKLERFWKTPIISNEAWKSGEFPQRAFNKKLGEFVRVGTWNIEKSIYLADVASVLSSETAYRQLLKPRYIGSRSKELLRQRERIASADILILQEIDIGVDRSNYINGPEHFAKKMGMNYAYAPIQLELSPVLRAKSSDHPETIVDPARYRGAFGLAVMSKYPIKSATCFQLKHQPYDWYQGERVDYDAIEHARRLGSELVFDTKVEREVKVGGRIFFRVDLEVPGLPNDTLSIIPIHLEIRAKPEDRERQLEEILSYIKDIPHPVVLAGDFNSARYDLSPTSIERVIDRGSRNPRFWLFTLSNLFVPAEAVFNTLRGTVNEMKNLYNPLAFHDGIFLPNEASSKFDMLEKFRFTDGSMFDFRGDAARSINSSKAILANSNEKMHKGYRTTFQVKRPVWPYGRHRLDWIFVKSSFYHESSNAYRFAPHFGETLTAFDQVLKKPLSDHRPNIVDLPIGEVSK